MAQITVIGLTVMMIWAVIQGSRTNSSTWMWIWLGAAIFLLFCQIELFTAHP